jgi:5-methyltetrahydrofolate--homocysteine methyltransferase
MEILKDIAVILARGDDAGTAELTSQALANGIEPKKILDDGLLSGMNDVGLKFRAHEIFLPDVLLAARAMYAGLNLLKPLLEGDEKSGAGTVVLGSVSGDLHDIGKNLVGIMLRGAGFDIIDLGNDVDAERFVEAAKEHKAKVIGLSALLTTTMTQMKKVVELVKQQGLRDKIKIIIGGAPVNATYAEEIGADAYAFDGTSAVDKIKELLDRQ